MKQQEKVDGGESQVGLLLFGQAASTEPYSAECRHNPMPIKLVEASTPQPCLITPSLHVIHKEKPPLLRAAVQMTRY
ncbi:hypothetical protein [Agrobacterium vitis]|uniref:hypothetical protein n=1 Tax=Agrobacterium vitis TaxID=373 RepID=UPI0015D9D196|nr:hypothetical protein [Agrobacterium vitis]